MDVRVSDEALRVWAVKCDGDARRALMALEVAVESLRAAGAPLVIDRVIAEESIQQKAAVYSGTGDEHFDTISAMIKSIRGSDPDAAVYWIARMLDAGEDPRYIARRLAILASEDVGNADPRAISVAASCWELVERIGMPEARINLAQCAIFLALCPKSNASYVAIERAMEDVQQDRTIAVPIYLRDSHSSPIATESGAARPVAAAGGERYQYSHDVPGAITGQSYLGVDRTYYEPTEFGLEKSLKERLMKIRELRRRARGESGNEE